MTYPDKYCVRIAFVCVDSFGPLKEAQINLSSAIRCSYQEGTLTVNRGEALPTGFWRLEPGKGEKYGIHDECITDVSLVVGENGTGKTSLAHFLAELCSCPDRLKKFVVVYRLGERYFCRYKGCCVKVVGDVKVNAERYKASERVFRRDVRFLYVTPHFSLHSAYENIDDIFAVDLSTRGLLVRRQWFDAKHGQNDRNLDPWGFERFERDEQRRMFHLLSAVYGRCKTQELRDHHIPILRGLLLSVDKFEVGEALSYENDACRQAEKVPGLFEYRQNQLKVAKRVNQVSDWFVRTFFAYALCYWHEHDICGDPSFNGRSYGVQLASFAAGIVKDLNVDKKMAAQLDKVSLWTHILAFLKRNGPRYDGWGEPADRTETRTVSPHYRFFLKLAGLIPLLKSNRHGAERYLSIREAKQHRAVISLLRSYRQVSGVCDFLNFGFYPRLSAGQEALLSIWSRVFDWFENPRRFHSPIEYQKNDPELYDPDEMSAAEFDASQEPYKDMDSVVLFFDEAETSLHPEWQRRMVSDMLWFVRMFGRGYHVQLVFATHSPIILSDVPMGNVAFLGACNSFVRDLRRLRNTFSANIFDLYRLPFALKDGTTGEFAKRKVARLIDAVKRGDKLSTADKALWKLIGDDFLRGCMNSVSKGALSK